MLPLKWKIFRVICYVHLAAVLIVLVINIFFAWEIAFMAENIVFFTMFFSMMTVLLLNTIINIVMLSRYYPHRKSGSVLDTLHIILLIFYILIIGLMTFAGFAMYFDPVAGDFSKADNQTILMALLWIMICLTGISICYFQISLRKTIRNNYQSNFDNFLNT